MNLALSHNAQANFLYLGSYIFFILHMIITAFMCLHLKRQLKNADLEKFKKLLGINYKRRLQTNGLAKYKWQLGIMQIKGSFDETNKLKELEIKPYPFFTINYRDLFLNDFEIKNQ